MGLPTVPKVCPRCREGQMKRHCQSPSCPWAVCIAKRCLLVLDLIVHRGMFMNGQHVQRFP